MIFKSYNNRFMNLKHRTFSITNQVVRDIY